ncbi:MAG: lipoprotein-releasing system permease protein [Bacteriovoracaceae bacterium]
MQASFTRYFFKYIFFAKTRQRLLFLAILGLIISSFALLVLQSTMGGLQDKLIGRSKSVNGNGVLIIHEGGYKKAQEVNQYLKSLNIKGYIEQELELLLKNGNYLAPVIVHGLDENSDLPPYFEDVKLKEVLLSPSLARRVNLDLGDQVRLISPAHTDAIMGDIPRTITLYLEDYLNTEVPEVDHYHLWVRLKVLQNMMRKKAANRIRFFQEVDFESLKAGLKGKFNDSIELKSWNEMNSTLVWALSLETTVMVFLFAAMTLLVSLCITSGLLIFFGKVKGDLASFWIMGGSKAELEKSTSIFLLLMSTGAVIIGLLLGLVVLYFLEHYGFEIMPEEFVDRKIPIKITSMGVFISFIVPTSISMAFSLMSFSQFKKETNFLDYVRTIG